METAAKVTEAVEKKIVKEEKKTEPVAKTAKETNAEKIFADRMSKKVDELRWLYMELYGNVLCLPNCVTRCGHSTKSARTR